MSRYFPLLALALSGCTSFYLDGIPVDGEPISIGWDKADLDHGLCSSIGAAECLRRGHTAKRYDYPAVAEAYFAAACRKGERGACVDHALAAHDRGDMAEAAARVVPLCVQGEFDVCVVAFQWTGNRDVLWYAAVDSQRRCEQGDAAACLRRARAAHSIGLGDALSWGQRACAGGSEEACGLEAHWAPIDEEQAALTASRCEGGNPYACATHIGRFRADPTPRTTRLLIDTCARDARFCTFVGQIANAPHAQALREAAAEACASGVTGACLPTAVAAR